VGLEFYCPIAYVFMAWTGQNLLFFRFILGLFNEAGSIRGVNKIVNRRTVR